jgi:phosphoglycerol transferase MdoB-like AlkP superfamily enzyme
MTGKGGWRNRPLAVVFIRMAGGLFLLALTRMLLCFFNPAMFTGLSVPMLFSVFLHGLRFDLSALFIVNAPYIFLQLLPFPFRYNRPYVFVCDGVFFMANLLALAANLSDVVYYRFTLKRTTADIFSYVGMNRGEVTALIPSFLSDFWYIFLLLLVMLVLLVILVRKTRVKRISAGGTPLTRFLAGSAGLLFGAFVAVVAIRGGFQLKPISLIDAGRRTEASYTPLVLNTPFTIAKTYRKEGLSKVAYFAKEEDLEKVYTPLYTPDHGEEDFRHLNVVVIILESFSAEFVGSLSSDVIGGGYKGYTPFLDSLAGHSLTFTGYANGKKSIEAIPAILSGLPSLMDDAYILSPYAGNRICSMASLLAGKGYRTAFFHGGTNGTMGFEAYARLAGYQQYFGRTEYNNEKDFDGKWGIFDEEFLQYTSGELDRLKEPFHAVIFTLSSHHPYTIPEKYKGRFAGGPLKIQASVSYADYALKRFFHSCAAMPWFANTLFVLTADHTAESYYPYYRTGAGQLTIPIIYYIPGDTLKGLRREATQQADILHSVMDFLHYGKAFVSFGRSVFRGGGEGFAAAYFNGLYRMVRQDRLIHFDGSRTISLYAIREDRMLVNNIAGRDSLERTQETFLKAFIQQYNSRVSGNRLTLE